MIIQTIISLVVIITLTVVMSFMLAKTIRQVNRQSKEYFEKKIVVYDDIIDQKQKQLNEIDSKLKNTSDKNSKEPAHQGDREQKKLLILNEKLPKYKVEGVLKRAKQISDHFNLNKEETVKKFISDHHATRQLSIQNLAKIHSYFNNDNAYQYITHSRKNSWEDILPMFDDSSREIMRPYIIGSPHASIDEILNYIKLEIDKADPEIVVETGDRADNFSAISSRIKTIYNPNIYLGIRILYQDHVYDYSLEGEA